MKKSRLLAGSILSLALYTTAPAFAQSQNPNSDGAAEEEGAATDQGKAIIVTGSRIARPTLTSVVPVTTVDVGDLTDQGDISLGDALNDLPSLRSTFSAGNSSRFIGTTGLNVLDLRGLGTARTLVLVNGKRHITAQPGDYLVDTNTIPTDLLQRVDIVTGGNSAIYGSDAVAGVVNFILKRDFEGITARAQSGVSSRGDRANSFVSLTAGSNFASGRGNIAVAFEYGHIEPIYLRDRDYLTGAYSGRCQFNAVDSDPANTPIQGQSSDGIADNEFFCGIRNGTISDGGTVAGITADNYLRFIEGGNLVVTTPDRSFRPLSSNQIGGGGSTLRNTGSLGVGIDRYSANLLAHFDVSDAFRPFIEAKYVRTDSIGEGQPSFFVGGPGFVGGPDMRCENPFLNAQALSMLQANGRCANVATGTFTLSRFNVDFGGRGENQRRETYRVVGGIEGTFNDDWNYEISANYGRFDVYGRSVNNLVLADLNGNPDGFNLAIDAARNAAGQIVCRVNQVTVTRPDCVPINVFGNGAPSQAALDFVNTNGERFGRAEEFDVMAFVSGDLSQLFELPGGPIGFAIGGEYRSEKARETYDELTAADATFLNALQPFLPPKLTVKEAFGEMRFPLLADLPFAQTLEISLAGRVSDYNTRTGTVYSYNVGGVYAPTSDIRFRANYSRAVRAPTQSDLFSPLSTNFAFIADPCEAVNLGGGPNRTANCAADGVPTTANAAVVAACASTAFPLALGAPWLNCTARTSSTEFVSGGNSTLSAEKSKSFTAGAAITPSFLPGFSLTVDYYNIEVSSLIATLGAQTIITNCYDNDNGINNPFCATVQRDSSTGLFVAPAVVSGGINYAAQKTEGVDVDVAYNRTFDNGHKISMRGILTRVITLNNFTDPTDPTNPNRQLSELGDPKWAANLRTSYDFGGFELTWNMRFIDKQTIGTYEEAFAFNGNPASNPDRFSQTYYPSALYHNFRIDIDVNKTFNFYGGIDNAFDKKPPLGLLGTAGGDPYDTFGRYFYVGAKANF